MEPICVEDWKVATLCGIFLITRSVSRTQAVMRIGVRRQNANTSSGNPSSSGGQVGQPDFFINQTPEINISISLLLINFYQIPGYSWGLNKYLCKHTFVLRMVQNILNSW